MTDSLSPNEKNYLPDSNNKTGDYKFSSRRDFLSKASAGIFLAVITGPAVLQMALSEDSVKAVAFDAFAIFDPRPVFALTEKIFPGKGKEIAENWRLKQFEYCWLRVSGNQYKDFWKLTEDALVYACRKSQVELSTNNRQALMNAYLSLEPWPDVVPVLDQLRKKGIRLALLSNMTAHMLQACSEHSRLNGYFEKVLSTDQIKSYKPSPLAYQMGTQAFQLKKSEILFVSLAGWDAAGSKWFGYPTFWVNRLDAAPEELNVTIDRTGKTLDGILSFL